MNNLRRVLLALISTTIFMLAALPVSAQEDAILALQSETTVLQTGQAYEVSIHIDNVNELWLVDTKINYDPAHLYVMGTESGSPIANSSFLSPEQTVMVRNGVDGNHIIYTASLLAPAEPVTGSGVVGTFQIFPLSPGTTRLLFSDATLTRVHYTDTETGQRIADRTEAISFVPVLLEFTVEGEIVTPPPEVTATPTPTASPDPALVQDFGPTPEPEATLVNVTAAPAAPTPVQAVSAPEGGSSPILILAVILILIGGAGFAYLVFRQRRQ